MIFLEIHDFSLQTMLVAIAFHAYFDVNIEELIADRKQYVWDKVFTCLGGIFNHLGLNKWANKKPLEKVQEKPGYINYEDVYKLLRRCNFTNEETENILEQHNIVPHEPIHENDVRNIFKDLMKKPQSPDEASETDPDSLDIQRITKQMDSLDKRLDRAHEDITVVISRLYLLRGVLPTNYAEDKENRRT
ncbi:uncharacterized protein LOC126838412 [Adelges cooleyi]|uniref:uncharacterized protein LOC126838412 n=1 Tax=Adelges cooleyi TaxID=133065 RepID=UPI00217FF59A|nr:uncharacterized protein LOC126838412 [Adelges cooleyi]